MLCRILIPCFPSVLCHGRGSRSKPTFCVVGEQKGRGGTGIFAEKGRSHYVADMSTRGETCPQKNDARCCNCLFQRNGNPRSYCCCWDDAINPYIPRHRLCRLLAPRKNPESARPPTATTPITSPALEARSSGDVWPRSPASNASLDGPRRWVAVALVPGSSSVGLPVDVASAARTTRVRFMGIHLRHSSQDATDSWHKRKDREDDPLKRQTKIPQSAPIPPPCFLLGRS